MPVERRSERVSNTKLSLRRGARLSAPAPLRTPVRVPVGGAARGNDRMPNGDPPNLMLWGDE